MSATGEAETEPHRLHFDRSIKLAFQGGSISSDDGLLQHRKLDDALDLTDMPGEMLFDPRTGKNGLQPPDFLRTLSTPEVIETS